MAEITIPELQAIADAINKTTGSGRDIEEARTLADAYVAANPEKFTQVATLTIQEVVASIDVLRDSNWLDQQWIAEAWLLHHFEAQNIGGSYTPQIRVVGEGV